MKKILHLFLILILSTTVGFGQSKLPDSNINVGVGLGMNYGIFGIKTVFGYRNSGLLLGIGVVPGGIVGYEIGAQISKDWFFANIGYGVVGTYQINNDPIQAINAGDILVGGMIGLGKKKRTFIDLGVGHTFGAPTITDFLGNVIVQNTFNVILGVGYRFGNKKMRKSTNGDGGEN